MTATASPTIHPSGLLIPAGAFRVRVHDQDELGACVEAGAETPKDENYSGTGPVVDGAEGIEDCPAWLAVPVSDERHFCELLWAQCSRPAQRVHERITKERLLRLAVEACKLGMDALQAARIGSDDDGRAVTAIRAMSAAVAVAEIHAA